MMSAPSEVRSSASLEETEDLESEPSDSVVTSSPRSEDPYEEPTGLNAKRLCLEIDRPLPPPTLWYHDGPSLVGQTVASGDPILGDIHIDEKGYTYFQTDRGMEQVLKSLLDPIIQNKYCNESIPQQFQGIAHVAVRLQDSVLDKALDHLRDDGNGGWKQSRAGVSPLWNEDHSVKRHFIRVYYRNDSSRKFKRLISYFVVNATSRVAAEDFAVISYYWSDGTVPTSFPVKRQRPQVVPKPKMLSIGQPNTTSTVMQPTLVNDAPQQTGDFSFSATPDLEIIRQGHERFAAERGWNQFHTPRNLLLAMVGEVGEVAELFQWKEKCEEGLPDWTAKEKQELGEELSDVLIYLVRLADKCHVDLPKAVEKKMQLNETKYPAHVVYGSSRKYTEYEGKRTEKQEDP